VIVVASVVVSSYVIGAVQANDVNCAGKRRNPLGELVGN